MKSLVCMVLVSLLAMDASAENSIDRFPARNPVPYDSSLPSFDDSPPVGAPALESELTVGEHAPDFDLYAADGAEIRPRTLEGSWDAIVFADSAGELAALKPLDTPMRSMRVHLLGICPADLGALSRLASAQDVPFPLLSDPTRQIAGLYGMYDDETEQVQSGIVLLDPQGIVRMAVPVARLQPEEVLALVQRMVPQPAAMIAPSPGR